MPGSADVNDPPVFLKRLFAAAVAAVQPGPALSAQFPAPPRRGRLIVIGAGKAAAAMALAAERHYASEIEGLVIVPEGYALPCARIEIVEAAHPVPDARGMAAALRILHLAETASVDDLVLCLLSGGASALMGLPAPGVTLVDKRAITTALLRSGAAIGEINCVRKHLSAVKGGRLAAAAAPARIVSLIVSDVVGDDPAVIASGPTVPDPTTCGDAIAVLDKYKVSIPPAVHTALANGLLETPKQCSGDVSAVIVARPSDALAAAAAVARGQGLDVLHLGDACEGEARAGAASQAQLVRAIREGRHATRPPCVILSGGEYTVTVAGEGRGGPNTEFALALALDLAGLCNVWALAADTDGRDGAAGAAGAVVGPQTLQRARAGGDDPEEVLRRNDSAGLFHILGDLVNPGPTRTNVNDFRAILVLPEDMRHIDLAGTQQNLIIGRTEGRP